MNSSDFEILKGSISKQVALDQSARNKKPIDWNEINEIDAESCEMVKEFIEKFGYPSVKKYGEDLSHNCWLLTQHAAQDVNFQKKYLELMIQENEKESEIDRAYLTDRLATMQNEPQIYGTQFNIDEQGNWSLYKIKDNLEKVNKRRVEIGLEPLAG